MDPAQGFRRMRMSEQRETRAEGSEEGNTSSYVVGVAVIEKHIHDITCVQATAV